MTRDDIEYPVGIPRWFTYLAHLWYSRRCRRNGEHVQTRWASCDYCGQKLRQR